MTKDGLADTAPDLSPLPPESLVPRPVEVDIGARTHRGHVRHNNEDNFHVARFGRYLRTLCSSLRADQVSEEDRFGYGFVVADGMGGHAAGEVASRRAIALLVEFALQTPDWILGRADPLVDKVAERTAERFRAVNTAVSAEAQSQRALRGMGTTLSLALSIGDDLVVAHVGDTRVYLFRAGELRRLTIDHTAAQQYPWFDPESTARFRNVLTRVIGIPHSEGPDVDRYRLAEGDRLLICTDGLTDMVDDAALARELARTAPADQTCQALVDLALDGGGKDNVTVIVAAYHFPDPPAA